MPKIIRQLEFRLLRTLGATFLGLSATSLGAQEPQLVDISPCTAIASAVARLDCYDALAESARKAGTPATPTRSAPAAARASSPPAAERAPRDPRSSASENEPTVEIASEVAALREIQPGRLEITLTNGQTWRQVNSDRYRLHVGHEVVLYPTRFGEHYRLSAPALRGFIQVDRVR